MGSANLRGCHSPLERNGAAIKMTKLEALRIIHSSAKSYNENLVNRNVLFISLNNGKAELFEASFLPRNFLHLTGVCTELNSTAFYSMARRDRLSSKHIDFASDGTTEKKLDVLKALMNIHITARMLGDYDYSQRFLVTDKLAGTVTSAMGFRKDGEYYVPNTSLKTDVRVVSKRPVQRIVATFIKRFDDEIYSDLMYLAKDISLSDSMFVKTLGDKVNIPQKI